MCIGFVEEMLFSFIKLPFAVSDPPPVDASAKTMAEFNQVMAYCKNIFVEKMKDYGTSCRILRIPSLTDQLFIKAKRIRTLQQLKQQAVSDDPLLDFVGIVNYAVMALIQLRIGVAEGIASAKMAPEEALLAYTEEVAKIEQLLVAKNHDYGEAWRQMRPSSLTDQLLMKLLRLKQIEDTPSALPSKEDIESIYQDIVNYAVFSLILLKFSDK